MAGDGYVLKSYQYFRITMVVLVVALGFAGVLATIVALVPTGPPELLCPADGSKIDLDADTASYVTNNVPALIVSGLLACVAAYLVARRTGRTTLVGDDRNLVIGFAFGIVLIAGGAGWYFLDQDSFLTKAHGTAAAVMFVLVGIVVVINARRASGAYRWWYATVVACMAIAAVAVLACVVIAQMTDRSWRHAVLLIEILEIGPFAAFWTVQTVEHWTQPIDRTAVAA
ncbi:MAG: hypothetical protein HZB15_09510 [Actinobacteria bacterium]|nr:hypothetical protein [Actinomycetota bacterium]